MYIGEGDIVADRIKTHVGDGSKDFWTRGCFITSKDSNFTKAHARYLENRLIQLTRVANRANLDGEITVLKGSRAAANKENANNQYGPLRAQLIKEGLLNPIEGHPFLEFAEDVIFPSPIAAAAVIKNRNSNQRQAWTLKTTGQTLKEWQDAQILPAT